MRFRDLGFRAKLYTLVGVFAANFLLFALCSSWMRSEVQVEGPLYHKIKGMQDLRADILPPPLSLLEPALLLNEIAKDPSVERRAACRERFEECRKEFQSRFDYWKPETLGTELDAKLYAAVVEPADKFYKLSERSLGTLLQADGPADEDPMRRSDAFDLEWPKLQQLYIANQKAINQLSVETERLARANEKAAIDSVRWWTAFMLILGAGNLAFVLALSSWIAASIVRPTRLLIDRMREMSQGAGDLTTRIPVDSQDEIGQLAQSINTVVQRLHDLVSEIKRSSIDLMSTATQIAATAKMQESTMQSFGASSTEIAAAVKEISATSQQLAVTMDEVNRGAENAGTLANGGRSGLTEMEAAMHRLAGATSSISAKLATIREKADDINMVVTTITKVADQTNLLSINAAIEAEKAGEYGRGFLVVAREIRRLADQTAVATLDIDNIVRHMQSAVTVGVMEMDKFHEEVRNGVSHVGHINGQLGQVIEAVVDLKTRFEPASEGMRQQSLGASQIDEAMGDLTSGATQTATSLTEFKQATDRLREAVERLRQGVALFTVAN
jgi:methyl-accepting chemotaxis protein WspA